MHTQNHLNCITEYNQQTCNYYSAGHWLIKKIDIIMTEYRRVTDNVKLIVASWSKVLCSSKSEIMLHGNDGNIYKGPFVLISLRKKWVTVTIHGRLREFSWHRPKHRSCFCVRNIFDEFPVFHLLLYMCIVGGESIIMHDKSSIHTSMFTP